MIFEPVDETIEEREQTDRWDDVFAKKEGERISKTFQLGETILCAFNVH